jgi:hypothetical protein
MVAVTVVGERLEINVFEDGHVEFSRFRGDEGVEPDADQLVRIIRQHGDGEHIKRGASVRHGVLRQASQTFLHSCPN